MDEREEREREDMEIEKRGFLAGNVLAGRMTWRSVRAGTATCFSLFFFLKIDKGWHVRVPILFSWLSIYRLDIWISKTREKKKKNCILLIYDDVDIMKIKEKL